MSRRLPVTIHGCRATISLTFDMYTVARMEDNYRAHI